MTLFIVLHIFICIFLVCVILLQPGKADGGIGFGSSSQSVFGSKGASNFLTKTTSACALMFLATSFFLTRSRIREYSRSVIGKEAMNQSAPAKPGTAKAPISPPAAKGVVPTAPTKADLEKAAAEPNKPAANATAKPVEPAKVPPPPPTKK